MPQQKTRSVVRWFPVLAVVLTGLVISACSSSPSTPARSTTTASTRAATTTTAVKGSTTTGPSVQACAFSQLSLTASSNGATGHIAVVIVFTNSGATTCLLEGYPGVAGLDSSGQQVVQATRTLNGFAGGVRNASSPPVVTLASQATASATVEGTDVPTGTETTCPSYPSLLVTPPNTTQSVHVAEELPGCSPIEVHPVVPGTTGSSPPS